jgi:integrase
MGSRLTKRVVDAAVPGVADTFIWDTELRGFGCRVSPKGRRVFVVQYRTGGRGSQTRRETLGPYGVLTVNEARDRARRILGRVADGHDPVADKRAVEERHRIAREAEEREVLLAHGLRFDRLAERWMAEHVAVMRKSATQAFYRLTLDNHVLPTLGRRDTRSISKQDVANLLRGLAHKKTTGNRAVAVIAAVYSWALRMEILPDGCRNPAIGVELFREQGRERFLTVEELSRLGAIIREAETVGIEWTPRACDQAKHAPKAENRRVLIAPEAAAALRLLLFTGARLREILHLEWISVDVERGLIRLRDSKVGARTLILNSPARAVLAGLPRDGRYVIPGEPSKGPAGTAEERPRADLKRPWAMVSRAAGLTGVRLHDLRHSFASIGAGGGHGLTIIGKLLGHSQHRTTQRYAHLADDPLRRASDGIANRIAAAMGEGEPEPLARVVALRAS